MLVTFRFLAFCSTLSSCALFASVPKAAEPLQTERNSPISVNSPPENSIPIEQSIPGQISRGISPSASFRPIESSDQRTGARHGSTGSIQSTSQQSIYTKQHTPPAPGGTAITGTRPGSIVATTSGNIQQVAFMQSGGATMPPGLEIPSLDAPTRVTDTTPSTSLPPTGYGAAPQPSTPSSNPNVRVVPPPSNNFGQPATNSPGTLTPRATTSSPALTPPPSSLPPSNSPTLIPSSASDQTPIATPQLPNQWATVGNCNLVSPPSTHQAGFWGCGPPVSAAGGNPYRLVPPTTMPNDPKALAVNGDVGLKPLCNLCSTNGNVVLGQGILGQPKAYVAGQCFRNFVRYLTP